MSATGATAAAARPPVVDAGPGVAPATPEWHRGWLKVAIALVAAGQGMAFGLAAYLTPPETVIGYWLLHGVLAASAIIVFALLGGPLLRESVAALCQGRLTVDWLFLVSLGGAFTASVLSTVRGSGPIFYELVAMLLAIYTVGKLLGARSRAQALRAVEELRAEHDTCVVLGPEGSRRRVAAGEVRVGECVAVAAGEAAAVDGVIRAGRGLVRTTPLTGEPQPVTLGPGDALLAGMWSVDGAFVVEVTAPAGKRRLDEMLHAIEQARIAPSRLSTAADRIAARFVPLVLLVGAGTYCFWLWHGTLTNAIENGLAVLVVACPCALGLATPLGIWAGLVRLGRLGVVARSGDFLEALATADVAMFDKTGTLCEPELQVARFEVRPTSPLPEAELRAAIAVAEAGIAHPVAEALRAALVGPGTADADYALVEARVVPGGGVRAQVRAANDGWVHEILAGTPRLLAESGVAVDETDVCGDGAAGLRLILVAVDSMLAGRVALVEKPRAQAREVFDGLRELGLAAEILTGDPAFPATMWPDVRRWTGLTPAAKAEHVRRAQAEGARVLYVGDGLNDAPALAVADAAVAVRHGS